MTTFNYYSNKTDEKIFKDAFAMRFLSPKKVIRKDFIAFASQNKFELPYVTPAQLTSFIEPEAKKLKITKTLLKRHLDQLTQNNLFESPQTYLKLKE